MNYDTRMTYGNVKIHKNAEPVSDECWVKQLIRSLDSHELTLL